MTSMLKHACHAVNGSPLYVFHEGYLWQRSRAPLTLVIALALPPSSALVLALGLGLG